MYICTIITGAALEDYHKTDEVTVAKSFAASAEALKAQFVLNTGDNFYYYGVKSTSDPMWENTFEQIYTQDSLMVPWYGVLGNHDYGYNPTAQTQYKSPNKDRWYLPSLYYTKRIELGNSGQYVTLIMIDTSPCVSDYRGTDQSKWDPCGTEYPGPADCVFHQNILKQNCTIQYNWLKDAIQKISNDDWVIAVGHHPADEINVEDMTTLLQEAKVDLYLNGHTHELAQYEVDGNSAYLTTGAGCMVRVDDMEHVEEEYDHAGKLLAKNQQNNNNNNNTEPTTLVDLMYDGEEVHRHKSSKDKGVQHSYSSVWYKRVAGYTTHTFSEDLKQLTTTFLDGAGNKLRSFTVKKGAAPTPGPTPGPSPGPSPPGPSPSGGTCCYENESKYNPDCDEGNICCKTHCADPSTCSYTKEGCDGYYGQKHNCVWNGSICKVGKK